MRPDSAIPTLFVLVVALLAAPPFARADEALHQAEASFVDASFERLLDELGLSLGGEWSQPDATGVFCDQMCARFREGGLISLVDCPARCGGAPAQPNEPTELNEPTEGADARSDIDVSRNNSAAVVPTAAAETSQP